MHIPFVSMVMFEFLAYFPVDHIAYQTCLALYSFCANLLHSLIMWLIVSSLSPHIQHLLFCCVLSILDLIWFVLMALSCTAIRRDSVSLLMFPFLSQVQVFWCEMLFNTIVWMVSSRPLISKSFSTNLLGQNRVHQLNHHFHDLYFFSFFK